MAGEAEYLRKIMENTAGGGGGGVGSTAVDRSGTIATGGAAQQVMAANADRRAWTFVNISDTAMVVSPIGTATATAAIPVDPGQLVSGDETNAISVFCAVTGKAYSAWEN